MSRTSLLRWCKNAWTQGSCRHDAEVKVVAYHFLALGTTVPAWFDPAGPLTPDDIAASATELVLHGLRKR